MKGGDPYIRALMRTISASEASGNRPYSLLYGGEQVNDLSHHPQKCITIVTGRIQVTVPQPQVDIKLLILRGIKLLLVIIQNPAK